MSGEERTGGWREGAPRIRRLLQRRRAAETESMRGREISLRVNKNVPIWVRAEDGKIRGLSSLLPEDINTWEHHKASLGTQTSP